MVLRNWKGVFASATFGVALVIVIGGCSSSTGGTSDGDAAAEASHPPRRFDASFDTDSGSGGEGGSGAFEGTTGRTCATDADCNPKGSGLNQCSNGNLPVFAGDPFYPTPVCLTSTPCSPGTGSVIHFCDGPDDPNSPGVCVSAGTSGVCLPQCLIPNGGGPPVGCKGLDRCRLLIPALDSTNKLFGIGFCIGGCIADTDCPTGSACQKDDGSCVVTPTVPTKALGQTCSVNDPAGSCFCYNSTSGAGYCTQFCVVGPSSPAPCPSGYACDARLPAQVLNGGTDASMAGFTTQNNGLYGYCLQSCGTADGGTGGDGGAGAVDAGAALDSGVDSGSAPAPDSGGDAVSEASGSAGSDSGGTNPVAAACPAIANCSTRHAVGPVCLP